MHFLIGKICDQLDHYCSLEEKISTAGSTGGSILGGFSRSASNEQLNSMTATVGGTSIDMAVSLSETDFQKDVKISEDSFTTTSDGIIRPTPKAIFSFASDVDEGEDPMVSDSNSALQLEANRDLQSAEAAAENSLESTGDFCFGPPKPSTPQPLPQLYLHETFDLMLDRWQKLNKDFFDKKSNLYDLTKV
jgi:hypothetical protein